MRVARVIAALLLAVITFLVGVRVGLWHCTKPVDYSALDPAQLADVEDAIWEDIYSQLDKLADIRRIRDSFE